MDSPRRRGRDPSASPSMHNRSWETSFTVELPEIGRKVEKGGDAAVVESVKAARRRLCAGQAARVVAVNQALDGAPRLDQ